MSDLYQIIEPEFQKLVLANSQLERLWTGGRWCEGPAWFPAGKYVIWSDIPNNRTLRWDETSGSISEFERPAGYQNGHTVDNDGRLISCEHQGRCISRIEHDGTTTTLARTFEGKRFNSPNDVIVKSDNSVWFSDPTYGIDTEYEGDAAPSEIGASNVYRIDPDGSVTCVIKDLVQPNGLAFSPDERELYVVDSGITHDPNCVPKICSYTVDEGTNSLGTGRVISTTNDGHYDGFRVDAKGRIWTSAGDGIHCIAPDGTLLGKILIPEVVANLCFIGPKKNRLFVCATTSIYAIYVNATGLK
ncbi:SMP-30/gluconolactonase/LRE family protein [Maritalea myrionectae]|uniref:SMP-30/gluconolactonase/LRE family protein n=1 Tax=Maritalea myrionectae TaxID=454601 RepID=UPI000400B814|nr:SMP-30/gluconolactonase/LRE family protein [Maritalea myrionectae]